MKFDIEVLAYLLNHLKPGMMCNVAGYAISEAPL